ncbi:hypothetical protein AB3R30_16425 [Leptolyngbyaceae cyanobacterium UHCC 1019]
MIGLLVAGASGCSAETEEKRLTWLRFGLPALHYFRSPF